MKKIATSIIFIVIIIVNINAQIVLEHSYPSGTASQGMLLYTVQLEVSGTKYIALNRDSSKITLYNLDHTVFKVILINMSDPYDDIFYISEKLFDTDNGIEYMLSSGSSLNHVIVYNEDGSVLWSESDCSQGCSILWHITGRAKPIMNTDAGTKLFVHICASGCGNSIWSQIKVYSLPGTLLGSGLELHNEDVPEAFKVYPNPSQNQSTIEYNLPQGESKGELIIYDIAGAEVKRILVTNGNSKIVLDNSALQSGTYFYQLITSKGAIGTKKMVLVK